MPKRIFSKLAKPFVDRAVRAMTDPVKTYNPSEVTNLRHLKSRLKIGDVLLVSGNARISYVVRILTTSQWSHVVLYVGDRQDLLNEEEKQEWRARYGEDALRHLVIDADPVRRVHLRPVDEYVGLMIRHCRAEALSKQDNIKVVDHALNELGKEYDVKHIMRLLFFFAVPWEFLPEGVRRFITDFTLSESDQICSRVLAEAFHSVGFPIRPIEVIQERGSIQTTALQLALGLRHRRRSAARLLAAGKVQKAYQRITDKELAMLHLKEQRHITPSDYDLSRFFSVIKDAEDLNIDYHNIAVRQLPSDGEQ
jgi:hypothetical protein